MARKRGGFFRLLFNSMDGQTGMVALGDSWLLLTIICLVLWVVLSATGMQRVFYRLGQLQNLFSTFGQGSAQIKEWQSSKQFSLQLPEHQDEKKLSPFMQVVIANLASIFALVLFLTIMSYFAGSGAGLSHALVTTGSCSVPLTVGMTISYLLFKLADSITDSNSNMPGILYGIGLVVIAMAAMTAFIAFYVEVMSVLGIKTRRRYYTTTFGALIAIGVFGAVSRWLIS